MLQENDEWTAIKRRRWAETKEKPSWRNAGSIWRWAEYRRVSAAIKQSPATNVQSLLLCINTGNSWVSFNPSCSINVYSKIKVLCLHIVQKNMSKIHGSLIVLIKVGKFISYVIICGDFGWSGSWRRPNWRSGDCGNWRGGNTWSLELCCRSVCWQLGSASYNHNGFGVQLKFVPILITSCFLSTLAVFELYTFCCLWLLLHNIDFNDRMSRFNWFTMRFIVSKWSLCVVAEPLIILLTAVYCFREWTTTRSRVYKIRNTISVKTVPIAPRAWNKHAISGNKHICKRPHQQANWSFWKFAVTQIPNPWVGNDRHRRLNFTSPRLRAIAKQRASTCAIML